MFSHLIKFVLVIIQPLHRALVTLLMLLIRAYQLIISPLIGQSCRFYPSCSEYSKQALQTHGVVFGLFLSIKRLLKCHPWHPGGLDLVSKPKTSTEHSHPTTTNQSSGKRPIC